MRGSLTSANSKDRVVTGRIEAVGLTAAHEGEAAFAIKIRFANGGCSQVQIQGMDVAKILSRARMDCAQAFVGQTCEILKVDMAGL